MKEEDIVVGQIVWGIFDWIGESHLMMGVVTRISPPSGCTLKSYSVTWVFGAPPGALKEATQSSHFAKNLYPDPDAAAEGYLSNKREEIFDHVWRAKRCLDDWDFTRWNQWKPGYGRDDRKAEN